MCATLFLSWEVSKNPPLCDDSLKDVWGDGLEDQSRYNASSDHVVDSKLF